MEFTSSSSTASRSGLAFEGIRINRHSLAPQQFGRRKKRHTGSEEVTNCKHAEWQVPVTAIRSKERYCSQLFVTSDRRPSV